MKEKKYQKKCGKYFCEYAKEFCETTTIHGFAHMVEPRRHWLEKVFWALIILGATAFAAGIIHRTYTRYDNDPIVITIDKDFRNFSVFIPATTVCLQDKLNETKAKEIIKSKWNVDNNAKSYSFYMDFLKTLSNSSYENLQDFERFSNNAVLNSENLAGLMNEINTVFDAKDAEININVIVTKPADFHVTLTEMGICFSTYSVITYNLTPKKQSSKNLILTTALSGLIRCHFYDITCAVDIVGYTKFIKFYIHSPFDLPDSASKYWIAPTNLKIEPSFSFLSIKPHKPAIIRALKKKQRECQFLDESSFPESPYYSLRLCRMSCRRKLAMELCKCVPHFYIKRANQPYCDLKGLVCLSKHSDYIIKLVNEKGTKYRCTCYPSCVDTEYILSNEEIRPLTGDTNKPQATYGWKVEPFPKMALKIDLLFELEDLIVSVGSTIALFLGCSIMSFVEVIYYFTLRMIRYFYKLHMKKKNDRKHLTNEENRFNYFAWENNNKKKIYVFQELQTHLYN